MQTTMHSCAQSDLSICLGPLAPAPLLSQVILSTAHDWNPLDSIIGLCVVAHHDEVTDWAMLKTQVPCSPHCVPALLLAIW